MEKYEELVKNIKQIIEKLNGEYKDIEIAFKSNLNRWEGYLFLKKNENKEVARLTLFLEDLVDYTDEKLEEVLIDGINFTKLQANF